MNGKKGGHTGASSYNRREVLGNAGKLAGALLAFPLLSRTQGVAAQSAQSNLNSKSAVPAKSTQRRTIGVLLPQSSVYTQLGASFLAGMNLYLSESGRQGIKIVSADVGTCCGQARSQTEAMLRAGKVDLLVGIVNSSIAASLRPHLEAYKVPFIASNLGENVARTDEASSYIFHHTLGLWQANWNLGKWAATYMGKTAVIAMSYHDSGYDAQYAFRMGFESAGGKVLATHVTHRPAADKGLTALTAAIKATKPAVVFASYYGQAAIELLDAYSRAGLSRTTPLLGTAFLSDQAVVKAVGSAAVGVTTALPWAASLSTAENQAFVAAYQRKTGKAPDAFAVLGYETASLAIAALDNPRAASVLDALAGVAFSGPRGTIAMDSSTQSTVSPHYLHQARQLGINVRNAVLSELPSAAERDAQVAALRSTVKTGWVSSYLCG